MWAICTSLAYCLADSHHFSAGRKPRPGGQQLRLRHISGTDHRFSFVRIKRGWCKPDGCADLCVCLLICSNRASLEGGIKMTFWHFLTGTLRYSL